MEQYGNSIQRVTTTVTAAGTTTLVNTSSTIQNFTGTTTQTVILPVMTTFSKPGASFEFYNNSTGAVTVLYQDSTSLAVVAAGSTLIVKVVSNSTANGTLTTLTNSSGAALNPSSWMGYHDNNGVNWTTASTSFVDFTTAGPAPVLTTRLGTNFPAVTTAASNLPGIIFTPAATGVYRITLDSQFIGTSVSGQVNAGVQMVDGSSNILGNSGVTAVSSGAIGNGGTFHVCGFLNVTVAGTPVTVKLLGAAVNSGGGVNGTLEAQAFQQSIIEWQIVRLA